MLRPRVIPVLTLNRRALVKTMRFRDPLYLGDPINALRIFNTKEVDELVILDITASREQRVPDLDYLAELASECFMPVTFGGAVATVETAQRVLETGIEKVCVNTAALRRPDLVNELAESFGSQAVVVSVDVGRTRLGQVRVMEAAGKKVSPTPHDPVRWTVEVADRGAGEILLTSVEREGTAEGYDLTLVRDVAAAVTVPVVALGGAGSEGDLRAALHAGAAAAAAGRLFVTHGRHRAALVSYPSPDVIESFA